MLLEGEGVHRVRVASSYLYQNVNVIPPVELAELAADRLTFILLSDEPSAPIGINPSNPELVKTVDPAL